MVTEQSIRQIITHVEYERREWQETLDFMLASSLEALKKLQPVVTPNEATVSAISSNEELRVFIMQMEVDVRYDMPKDFRYEWIRIENNKSEFKDECGYSWAMERNYAVTKSVGYVYPTKGNYVQHFKTEAGAKKNLIKYLGDYFREGEKKEQGDEQY